MSAEGECVSRRDGPKIVAVRLKAGDVEQLLDFCCFEDYDVIDRAVVYGVGADQVVVALHAGADNLTVWAAIAA